MDRVSSAPVVFSHQQTGFTAKKSESCSVIFSWLSSAAWDTEEISNPATGVQSAATPGPGFQEEWALPAQDRRKRSCLVRRQKARGQEGSRCVNLKFSEERRKDCCLSYNFQLCEGPATTDHHYALLCSRHWFFFFDEVQGTGKHWIFISSLGRLSILPNQTVPNVLRDNLDKLARWNLNKSNSNKAFLDGLLIWTRSYRCKRATIQNTCLSLTQSFNGEMICCFLFCSSVYVLDKRIPGKLKD